MTPEEKKLLVQEIPRYIKENCYYTDGSIKYFDLWLVGWVAAEFQDRKNAMRVLINNEYGLLGNLLNKLARSPDASIIRLMERLDLEVILKAIRAGGNAVLQRNELDTDPYAMRLLVAHDVKYAKHVKGPLLNDKAFLLSVVGSYPEILQSVFSRTLTDEEFVFSLVKKNYEGIGSRNKRILIDGYYYSELENCLVIIACPFSDGIEIQSLTATEAEVHFNRARAFVEEAKSGFIQKYAEESSPGYGLALDVQKRCCGRRDRR